MLDEDGNANVQLFCLQQFATSGGDLPVQSLAYPTSDATAGTRLPIGTVALCSSLFLIMNFIR